MYKRNAENCARGAAGGKIERLGGKAMRFFEILDEMEVDADSGVMTLSKRSAHEEHPQLSMRREGAYMAVAARYGPLEVALRPRYDELVRVLSRLQPVEGLQTTRQVGTSQAYLAAGLRVDGSLLLRATIVADAAGHFSFNLGLTPEICRQFFDWVPVDGVANSI
jgi:hypothetical protein